MQGINKVSSDNCWASINSEKVTAINAIDNSQGTAQGLCTVGGVDGAEHFAPRPFQSCDPMDDPCHEKFKNYNVKFDCDHTDLELKSGSFALTPGTYCGTTKLRPAANVTLMPDTYVFNGGELTVQAGAKLAAKGVTLFFEGVVYAPQ